MIEATFIKRGSPHTPAGHPITSALKTPETIMTKKFLACLLALVLGAPALWAGQYESFKVAVYVRAYEVQKMKDPEWLRTNWAIVEKQLKVDKVYLEVHRDLIIVDADTLAKAKAFFQAKGIAVAGGIATVKNERKLFETFDYTNPDDRAKLKEIVTATAKAFDEFIIDDFFFTSSKSESAIAAQGSRSWAEFRLGLMTEVSQHLVLDVARSVNPKVRVIIKYPNWYEHFQGMGYNLETQPRMFDEIYTGTETRDSVYNAQHLQPYQGYMQVRYFDNIKPGGNGGGWVDTGDRIYSDRYAEQLWMTMLAKAPEIMLFAFHELLAPLPASDRAPWQGQGTSFDYDKAAAPVAGLEHNTMARVAAQALEQIDPLVAKLGTPVGIASYRPYHSRGEDFLHNYLGMIGIPIDLHPEFPTAAPTVLLTADAALDPDIVGKIKGQLVAGKTVVVTTGLVRELQERGLRNLVELTVGPEVATIDEVWGWRSGHSSLPSKVIIPQLHYNTNDSWALMSGMARGDGYPILHFASYGKGTLYVLTIPESFADLYQFPPAALNSIRATVAGSLFVRMEGPSRVALMAYDNGAVVVESFRDEAVDVSLVVKTNAGAFRNEVTGEEIAGTREKDAATASFPLHLKPHSYVVLTQK
jgi:hypothetical protein